MSDTLPQKPSTTSLPANETQRLAALYRYRILDTPPEAAFDRITRLAAQMFNVPTVLISLVDETRAWFKSCIGFDVREVPRDATLYNFATLTNDLLIVPDTRQGDRFACNPLVQSEPGVRFYAGAPLLSHDGFNLGTLCLLDSQPRHPLSVEQQSAFVDLAAMVVHELELRLAAHQTIQSEKRYRRLFESIDEGFCVCELLFDEQGNPQDHRILEANPAFETLTGLTQVVGKTARELVRDLELFWDEAYTHVVRTGEPIRFEDYSQALDRWFDVYIFPTNTSQQNQFAILFTNITDRKQAEESVGESAEQLRSFVTASSDIVYKMSADWSEMHLLEGKNFLASTHNFSRTWLEQYIPLEEQSRVMAAIQEAIRTKSTFELEHRVIRLDGTVGWTFSRATPLLNAQNEIVEWFGAASDLTDRKRRELNAAFLDEISQELSRLSTPDEIMQTAGVRLGEFLQLSGCVFADVDEAQNEVTVHHGWTTADVPSLKQTFRMGDYLTEDFSRANRAGEAVIIHDTAHDERTDAENYARQMRVPMQKTLPHLIFKRSSMYRCCTMGNGNSCSTFTIQSREIGALTKLSWCKNWQIEFSPVWNALVRKRLCVNLKSAIAPCLSRSTKVFV